MSKVSGQKPKEWCEHYTHRFSLVASLGMRPSELVEQLHRVGDLGSLPFCAAIPA